MPWPGSPATGLRDIEIVDSVFNAPLEHAMNVCEALARVRHRARLQCLELNPLSLDDSLLAAMERAGFVGMGITLESASDPVLRGLKKGFTTREVHHAAEAVRRHGIPCAWIFLLGGPGETEETVKETLRFAEHADPPRGRGVFQYRDTHLPGNGTGIHRTKARSAHPGPGRYAFPGVLRFTRGRRPWMEQELKKSMNRHMNFLNMDSLGMSLPADDPSDRPSARFSAAALETYAKHPAVSPDWREWTCETGRAPAPVFPVYSPASRSMIGGIRYVASFVWDPPPSTTASFPPQTSPARSRIRQGDVPVARPGEADVAVVALVGVEAEIPEEEVGTEPADPVGELVRHPVEVDVVDRSARARPAGVGIPHVHLRPVGGFVIRAAETDVENVGVVEEDLRVPSPWWASVSRIANRRRPYLSRRLTTQSATSLKQQYPAEGVPAEWCPPAPMKAKALPISPPAIFSPAITTPPAECQAVEQSGSPFTPSISPGEWTFSTNSRETGPGS